MHFQRRHGLANELADRFGWDDLSDPAIGLAGLTLDQALLLEAVDNAGYRTVGESQLLTQVLEAHASRGDQHAHGALLGAGQTATRNLRFERLPEDLPDRTKVAVDFGCNRKDLMLGHRLPSDKGIVYDTSYTTKYTLNRFPWSRSFSAAWPGGLFNWGRRGRTDAGWEGSWEWDGL